MVALAGIAMGRKKNLTGIGKITDDITAHSQTPCDASVLVRSALRMGPATLATEQRQQRRTQGGHGGLAPPLNGGKIVHNSYNIMRGHPEC